MSLFETDERDGLRMNYDHACKVVLLDSKLRTLRNSATQRRFPDIDAQLAKLAPYIGAADRVVRAQGDPKFENASAALRALVEPITDGIADPTKINNALTSAANIIAAIVAEVEPSAFSKPWPRL